MSAGPRFDIVIVTWNHGADVDACLQALSASAVDAAAVSSITVVDNASDEPYSPPPLPALPTVSIVRNRRNVGFAAACNQGASLGRADFLLFLNPDAVVAPGALASAGAEFDAPGHDNVGLVGLRIVGFDGATHRTCGRFPTSRHLLAQVTGLARLAPAWFPGIRLTDWDHLEARDVDFISGACLFTRRDVFERLGGFDERFTVYLEDLDLARRAKLAGWRTRFLPHPPVRHRLGWSTGRDRPLRLALSWRSTVVYARLHLGRSQALAVTSTTVALAPMARIARAILTGSARDAGSACRATVMLWRMLWRDWRSERAGLPRRAPRASSTGETPPRDAA